MLSDQVPPDTSVSSHESRRADIRYNNQYVIYYND